MPAKRRRTHASLLGAVVAVVLSTTGLGTAGTSTDPEITDVAGDANFINGQGLQAGHEEGPDTRPASFDNVDLRAVWFETAYTTSKVFDPETGHVLRVEYDPTALVVHIQTQGPVPPMTPWTTIDYKVQATLPGCKALFELRVYTSPPAGSPARAAIWHDHRPSSIPMLHNPTTPCGNLGVTNGAMSPLEPTFEGTVATMTFPFSDDSISQFISNGTTITQPAAHVHGRLPSSIGSQANSRVDETVAGRDFTIGQDVPPDVDCTDDPGNPECQP